MKYKEKTTFLVFSLFLIMVVLLFSLKIVLFFASLTEEQKNTLEFSRGKIIQTNLLSEYTEKEIAHLKEVQTIFRWSDALFYFSLLIITLTLTYHRKNQEVIKKMLTVGGKKTIIFLAILLFVSLISFPHLFTLFHQIFFPQGNWQFPAESLLIQTFPFAFFKLLALKIFALSLFFGLLLWKIDFFRNLAAKKI